MAMVSRHWSLGLQNSLRCSLWCSGYFSNNNYRRLVTLVENTSNHGNVANKQTQTQRRKGGGLERTTANNLASNLVSGVCLSAVVGGMLCKSDKPSIIIIIINLVSFGAYIFPSPHKCH